MRLQQLSPEGRWQQMASLISDEMLQAFAIIGTPDEIAPQLKERWGTSSAPPISATASAWR
jgi:alkanesulfonate monooxygenase SsuD/methylene tetrahydromethanopterin reductase-like flavin-dependent oxidoreductase (luciferase family)